MNEKINGWMNEQTPQYEEQTLIEGRPQDHTGSAIPPWSQKTEEGSSQSIRHDLEPLVIQPRAQPLGAGPGVVMLPEILNPPH